jgi:hypothetical protein
MMHLALALAIAACPIGAFDYRGSTPAALFPFCQAAAEPSLPDAIVNPAYLPAIRYPYLHFSGGIPYTLGELTSSTLGAGYGTRGFGIRAAWDRFGFEQYQEHVVTLSLGYQPVRYVSLGAGAYYYNLSIDTAETTLRTHQGDARASIVVAPCKWFEAAFMQENIASLFLAKRRDLLFPEWSAGAALKPFRGFTLLYNITGTATGYVNTISAAANVLKYFSLRAGYAIEATTGAASLSFIYRYIAVSYGIKYHPHLGLTHSIGVTLSAFEMNIEPISYGEIFPALPDRSETAKTDINACSYEELAALPGVGAQHADRIMKYRKTIGPVTRTALLQVGMSEGEIARLMERVTGLAAETGGQAATMQQRESAERAQKRVFRGLVAAGVPASTALELSDLAVRGQREALAARIDSLRDLDRQKKKQVLELCTGPQ